MSAAPAGHLALLRLLQVADSAFPVGGYAYSHGVEWLVHQRRVTGEADLAPVLETYVRQVAARQWFPAALAAHRARSIAAVLRADDWLDASIAPTPEREAGRAMGERLLATAAPLAGPRTELLAAAVAAGRSPGQHAVAFAALAHDTGAPPEAMLAALGTTMVTSITQAALRLGVIGQAAAVRLHAATGPALAAAVESAAAAPARRPGAWSPLFDVAAALQPTLQFRMFAS
ncbi:MAG: hypothetical protein IT303_06450 [Dehalococcoidia bacterium]|nr:hypothetical protein [Dehalococcoidia bacterium]